MKKAYFTLPIGLSSMVGEYTFHWGQYAAVVFISIIPIMIIFAVFQNWFIKGLAAGAVKG